MLRISAAAFLILAASAPLLGSSARAADIDWSIQRSGTRPQTGKVQLRIESRWNGNDRSSWSSDYSLADLQGLSFAQLMGQPAPVRFALAREAGRLDCSGVAGNSAGGGSCSFAGNPAFASYLAARGIGRPDERHAFALTMSGVGRPLIDALTSLGYPRPTVDQLVAMGIHGVTPDYVRALATTGYRLKSADELVKFRIHGVSVDYIRAIAAAGPQLRNLPADSLVSFRIHGVTPELVRTYASLGHPLDKDAIVSMRIHGVTPQYIRDMAALGYGRLTADQLVSMRIHGVTADYVRALHSQGLRPSSADQIVRLRISGYRPGQR
jgi:hypothetical protein